MKYLDYIESSGNCYFDTGIKPSSKIKIVFKARIAASTGQTFIGATIASDDSKTFRFFLYQWRFYLDYGNGLANRLYGGNADATTDYELEIGNRYLKHVDGDYILSGSAVDFDYSDYDQTIQLLGEGEQGRIYYCKIYDDKQLVRDFIPVMTDAGEIGLYDRVSGTFFENQGTGTLTYAWGKKYLIGDADAYYTVVEGALQSIPAQQLSASAFEEYGTDEVPSGTLLKTLSDPAVYCWTDSGNLPSIQAKISAAPLPQTIYADAIDLSDPSVNSIGQVLCEYEGEPLIQLSFDGTWEYFDSGSWNTAEDASQGMTPDVLTAIPAATWAGKISGLDQMFLRVTLFTAQDKLQSIQFVFS